MSVFFEVKKGLFGKFKVDLQGLNVILNKLKLSFGVADAAAVLGDYEGGNDLSGNIFIIYDNEAIGRGFQFCVSNRKYMDFTLNIPSTPRDCEIFFDFVAELFRTENIGVFLHEGTKTKVSELDRIKRETLDFSRKTISEPPNGSYKDFTIFGATCPITLEDDFVQLLSSDKDAAVESFTKYLHEKQNHPFYYASPLMAQHKDGTLIGVYHILEDDLSVFPLTPAPPFFGGFDSGKISRYDVVLYKKAGDDYKEWKTIPYSEFKTLCNLDGQKHFDKLRVYVNAKFSD